MSSTGFLLKDRASESLIEAIRVVVGGGVYLDTDVRAGLRADSGDPGV